MAVKVVMFPESANQTVTQVIRVPGLVSVDSVTVDNGSSTFSVNGSDVTVTATGGTVTRSEMRSGNASENSTSYLVSSSSTGFPDTVKVTTSGGLTGNLPKSGSPYVYQGGVNEVSIVSDLFTDSASLTWRFYWSGNAWSVDTTWVTPATRGVSQDGYFGNIPYVYWNGTLPNYPPDKGTKVGETTTRTVNGTASYKGILTKTTDTRIYRQDYAGTITGPSADYQVNFYSYQVTIGYTDNYTPNNGFVKVNGVHKKIVAVYAKVNGAWKKGTNIFIKNNNHWDPLWKYALDAPTSLTYPATIQRGTSFDWTTTPVAGAGYELQIKTNGLSWSGSQFFTTNVNSYTVTKDISINTLQLRVRAVDNTDRARTSGWVEGRIVNLVPEALAVPTGLTVPASISRGDKVTASWNGLKGITYTLEVSYANSSDVWRVATTTPLGPTTKDGNTSIDCYLSTDTADKKVKFRLKAAQTGYIDSDYASSSNITLGAQKLGTVAQINVPHVTKGESVVVTWSTLSNANSYQLEIDYNRSGSWIRLYTGTNKSFAFTYPKDKTNVQMRVSAAAADYVTGDWRYAWVDYQAMTIPALKNKTWTATWTGNWRPNFGGEWNANNNYVYQGKWSDANGTWGNYKGMAIFDSANIQSTLSGKTIEKVQVYFYRINEGGYVSGQAIELYTHNYASNPIGQPSMNFVQGPFSSFARGEGKWITVDNSVAERIRDGSAKGIGLYRASGDGYLFMSANVQLYVEYR